MHPLEYLARLTQFTGDNLAYNLEFIPPDKLAWKPAETAKSALEIARHVSTGLRAMAGVLDGASVYEPRQIEMSDDLASAQATIRAAAETYAAKLRALDMSTLDRSVQTFLGPLPLAVVLTWPVVDLSHHHGQIAYLQTLLGDTEIHLRMPG